MGSNYIEMRLEDCMDAIIDYRGKTPKKVDNGIPLITAKIIKNGRIQEVNEFISINDYDDWMVRGLPLEGDVVLTTEAPLGEVAQLDSRKVALAQRVITLRGKKGILENDYLLYLLQSSFVQNQLDGRASGSTVTGIKQSELREIILRLPPVSLQKSISHQLKCLDKKIDLNNKINKILEQMSQTLFKSWFVDFDPVIDNALDAGNPIPEALQSRAELRQKVRNSADFKPLPAEIRSLFPSEFEETELGWMPKGWQIKSLDHIANFQNGLALQKFRPKNMEDDYLPVLKIADLRAGQITNDERARTDISDSCKVYDGDMIFSWSGTLMIDIWTGGNAALNQHLYKVTSKKYPQSFYFMWTKQHLSRFQHIAEAKAVTMGHIKKGDLSNSFCLIPTSSLITKYDNIVGGYLAKIKNQRLLNNQMTALRDTLLPKLISGELSLDDLPDLTTDTEAA
ncbi:MULTISPECIES: restriction endonuclease subunit S [Escherichia]|uniref:Restriction endonuclease subunit S n=1 Tax=Escherichia marmotae TaxID=1499973 RepID=A0A7H9K6X5_9ESCH|nr:MULTISPECIES: restriction endonuclease subunit S [Escherichia]EEV6994887.1 restriction endonuclease subunit S [Escherichia coli]EFO1473311.1 restriction endonuclease subunit S [Escherichia coli]MCL0885267.1 restriction endonuclease subunit S [Escherichia marmotae]MEC9647763.1 restriction endonuclease subunit S [Escherichia marmotae]MEC9971808.1 restriction endonuclease subunit S [Escherichia marmotae]